MSFELFTAECPGAAFVLRRLVGDCLVGRLGADYERVVAAGGNDELGVLREEGVSYNKRIARVLMILAKEVQCDDFLTLRLALYACAQHPLESGNPEVDCELRGVRDEASKSVSSKVSLVRGALILDRCRHLHMTSLSIDDQRALLRSLEILVASLEKAPPPEILQKKIEYSLSVHGRRLEVEDDVLAGAM